MNLFSLFQTSISMSVGKVTVGIHVCYNGYSLLADFFSFFWLVNGSLWGCYRHFLQHLMMDSQSKRVSAMGACIIRSSIQHFYMFSHIWINMAQYMQLFKFIVVVKVQRIQHIVKSSHSVLKPIKTLVPGYSPMTCWKSDTKVWKVAC